MDEDDVVALVEEVLGTSKVGDDEELGALEEGALEEGDAEEGDAEEGDAEEDGCRVEVGFEEDDTRVGGYAVTIPCAARALSIAGSILLLYQGTPVSIIVTVTPAISFKSSVLPSSTALFIASG